MERPGYLSQLIRKKHNGMIKVITGVRRCGKPYLLFELFNAYLRTIMTGGSWSWIFLTFYWIQTALSCNKLEIGSDGSAGSGRSLRCLGSSAVNLAAVCCLCAFHLFCFSKIWILFVWSCRKVSQRYRKTKYKEWSSGKGQRSSGEPEQQIYYAECCSSMWDGYSADKSKKQKETRILPI